MRRQNSGRQRRYNIPEKYQKKIEKTEDVGNEEVPEAKEPKENIVIDNGRPRRVRRRRGEMNLMQRKTYNKSKPFLLTF